jgi:hypothetical protein
MVPISAGHVALASVHSQMLRRRRESNKDGVFPLTCFLLLQDTWPRLLYTLKCCAGAGSLTKMALSHSHASYFCRTRDPGFCALPNTVQVQRVQQKWRCRTHMCSISAGHVALASVHYQMLRRRRESNKDGAFTLTCFLFLQDTWPWQLCTTKCCAGAESRPK